MVFNFKSEPNEDTNFTIYCQEIKKSVFLIIIYINSNFKNYIMGTNRTQTKIRLHDAIVGILYGLSVILSVTHNIQWLYLAGAVALLQIISPVTKFCPVYFVLNKLMPDTEPLQNGK